jgi:GntR family transcriptional regulator, transcriptional repressor for pyruvate dehydrogenase complex
VRAPQNPILAMFGAALETVFSERVTGMIFPAEERAAVSHDHASIVRAIRNGDIQRAERLTRTHMLDIRKFAYERYAGILDQIVDWR